jgi:hypothetical protein
MSNLILNDNVIGGSSNDSSDILYTPNDNRPETNVQDELDRINRQLANKNVVVSATSPSATGGWYKVANYPTGFAFNNCWAVAVTAYKDGFVFSNRSDVQVATKSDGIYVSASTGFVSVPIEIILTQ